MNTFLQGHENLKFLTHTDHSIFAFNHYMYRLIGIKSNVIMILIDILSPVLYILNILFSFLYFCYKCFFGFIIYDINIKSIPEDLDALYLFFYNYYVDRCRSARLYEGSKYFLLMPNIDMKFVHIPGKNIVDYKNYVKKEDAFKIWRKSVICLFEYIVNDRTHCLVHKAWEYFELEVSLNRIAPNCVLYFCNQSDKWSLLFDNVSSRSKVLLQHGVASIYGKVPFPLKHINKFYSMTQETWQDAYSTILDCKPELVFMEPTIHLYDTTDSKFRVLIVADIIHFEKEMKIIHELSRDSNISIYMKKHPALVADECYRDLQKQYNFTYIVEKQFPQVDFVISYYSTLAYEYMSYNIPVYMYINSEDFSLEKLKEQLYIVYNHKFQS